VRITSIIAVLIFLITRLSAQNQLSQTKPERLFQKGSELIDHANYGAARKVFAEFLTEASPSDPRRGEAEYYVAFSALNLSHTDGEKLIDDFIERYPASPKAGTAYFDLAGVFYEEKNYTKASQYYRKVDFPSLTQDQQNQAHFKWGYSYFNLKKFDEALEQFNFVKTYNSSYTPAANYYAGFLESSKGLYNEALIDLKKAEGNASYAAVVPMLIANVYYKQKDYNGLIEYANQLKGRDGVQNQNEIAMLVADAYYFKGDYEHAVADYDKFFANESVKAESSVLFRAGYANYSLNRFDKAIDYLNKSAAQKDSIGFYASYYLGILYLKRNEKPLAINAFDYARKNPKDRKLAEEATFQFAKASYDAGREEIAITELEKFVNQYPASGHTNEAREILAQAYVNGDNFHKAIEYIEALPSRNPHIDQAYQKATYLRGVELFNKGDYAEAVKNFEKSLRYPRDPAFVGQASFWAGEAYSIGRKYEEAIPHYQKVIALGKSAEPDLLIKTQYGLGYAHFNLQSYDKAQLNFRDFVNRSNRTTPNYTDGIIRLADCYYVAKEYDEALRTYSRARDIGSPDNDYVLLQSGVINGIQRKYTESRNQLTALITNYTKSQYRDEALYQRAQFEIEQGNYQAAVDGLSQLIRESANSRFLPYAYMRRASSYFNLKQYDRTVSDYATLIRDFSSHPVTQEVLLPLQEALSAAGKSGDFDNYLAQFKKANPENKGLESIEFETAKNMYFDQQYAKALAALNTFINSYPQSAKNQEARYYIAESHYRLREFDKALSIYIDLSKDPNFQFGSRVVGRLSEIQFKSGKYDDAIRYFHRLEKLASNKKEQYNAWSGLMESFYFLSMYDSSDFYARTILEKGAVSASAQNKASLFLGKSAYSRGDYETAKDEFLNTLNAAQDEYGAEAKYLLANIFYQQKQYKQSYETLISLNNDFAAYDEWVGKSFLLLADNFIAQEDYFQAKATLQSIVDNFPLEHVKEQARAKLKEVEKLELQKEPQLETDTTKNDKR
jgi:tetratricopeptide (TPR) repeat protein